MVINRKHNKSSFEKYINKDTASTNTQPVKCRNEKKIV